MAASDDVKTLEGLIADPNVRAGGKARYKNKSYSLAQLNSLLKETKKTADTEKKASEKERLESITKETQKAKQEKATQEQLDQKIRRARGELQAAQGNLNIAITRNGDINKAQTVLGEAYRNLQGLNPTDKMLAGVSVPQVSRGGLQREGGVGGISAVSAVPTVVKGARTSTATTGKQTNVPVTTTPKVTTTPIGTTTTTAGKGKKTPAPAVTQQNWVDALQRFFPSYSDDWLAANAESYFGKDLIDLMIRVSDPKGVYDLTTSAGLERIQQEIRGTNYWQTTISATKNFDQLIDADKQNLITQTKSRIANTYGDIGLTEDTLNQVAATVARTGLTGLGEKQAVYNAVFKAGAPQMQTGRALSGVDADRIKQLGKAYNFNVTDSQIQSILTGTPEVSTGVVLTEEGLRQRLQKYVKGAMPQIADQIDAGLTLEDIGGNYRRYAAQLLERSEDEIDMFSGPYLKAFGTKESGQLSLSDWISTVKTDPTFGWQYTKTANQQATDIGLTLARAFGKVS
jgi:uncharacterized protein (DUF697 family)